MRARRRHKVTRTSTGAPSRYRMVVRASEFLAPPPEHVVAEREAAFAGRQSITAAVFGDPPSGRSALDRRMRP